MTMTNERGTILDTDLTVDDPRALKLGSVGSDPHAPVLNVDDLDPDLGEEDGDERPPVSPFSAATAAFLSAAAVGWMLGGTFVGMMPRLIGVLGALIGAGAGALTGTLTSGHDLNLGRPVWR